MRTSFNIPDDLLAKFDHTWEHEGLESCSRAVREAMREYIEAHTRLEEVSGKVTALVTFDYDHKVSTGTLHDVQDEFQDTITTACHSNEGEWSLKTVFCQGEAARIRDLVYQLRDFHTVERVNVLILTPQTSDCHHEH